MFTAFMCLSPARRVKLLERLQKFQAEAIAKAAAGPGGDGGVLEGTNRTTSGAIGQP